mgnify:CR=1 FL=1
MESYGDVTSVHLNIDRNTKKNIGSGIVEFKSKDDMFSVLKNSELTQDDTTLKVYRFRQNNKFKKSDVSKRRDSFKHSH